MGRHRRNRCRRQGRSSGAGFVAVASSQQHHGAGGSRGSRRRPGPKPLRVLSPAAPPADEAAQDIRSTEHGAARSGEYTRALRVDFLVIGSGISGLSYALEAAEAGNVAIVTKDVAYEGSTHYAQGGISAVISAEDTVEEHVRDTQVAGDFLCDDAAVEAGGR